MQSSLGRFDRCPSSCRSFCIRNSDAALRRLLLLGFGNRPIQRIILIGDIISSQSASTQLVFELARRESSNNCPAVLVEYAVCARRSLVRKFISEPKTPNANKNCHHKCDHAKVVMDTQTAYHKAYDECCVESSRFFVSRSNHAVRCDPFVVLVVWYELVPIAIGLFQKGFPKKGSVIACIQ